jgi:hypothetical protein
MAPMYSGTSQKGIHCQDLLKELSQVVARTENYYKSPKNVIGHTRIVKLHSLTTHMSQQAA